MALTRPSSDFQATSLSGALAAGAAIATIGTGLSIPATNSFLQIDYDSTTAVGSDNGPETIFYATYTSGTGALTGIVRGQAGTTDVAHANGAKVQLGMSTAFLEGFVGARAYNGTQNDLTDATWNKLTLGTETYDVGSNFASGNFTAPVNGFYHVDALVTFTTASLVATKAYGLALDVDGAATGAGYAQVWNQSSVASKIFGVPLSATIYLAAGSYVSLYVRPEVGGNTVDVQSGDSYTYMSVHLIKEVTAITG